MTTGIRWAAVLVLLCPITALSGIKIRLRTVKAELIEQRLQGYRGDDSQREATLKHFFESAGCSGERLTEQPVKSLKQPNLICVLQGDTDAVILVGAHYDHVDRGDGVVDNWSGASLLPSLYEALNTGQRRYTLVFWRVCGRGTGLNRLAVLCQNDGAGKIEQIKGHDLYGHARAWPCRSVGIQIQ